MATMLAVALVACGGTAENPAASNAPTEVPNVRAMAVVPPAGPAAASGLQVGGTYALRQAGTAGEFVQAVGSASPAALASLTLASGATIPLAAQFVVMPGISWLGTPPAGCIALRTQVVVDLPYTTSVRPLPPFTASLPQDRYLGVDANGQLSLRPVRSGLTAFGSNFCPVPVANGFMLALGSPAGAVLQRVSGQFKLAVPDGTAAFAASATWQAVTVTAPGTALPPTVAIRSLVPGPSVTEGNFSGVVIDAADADGAVVKVELFNGFNRLSEAFEQPYARISQLPIGQYRWYARAIDQSGAATASAPVDFEVKPQPAPTGYLAPKAALTARGATTVPAGSLLELRADYALGTGTAQRVEFMEGNTVLGASTQLPVNWAWAGPVGSHALTVRLTDFYGNRTTSAPLQVNLTPLAATANQPPSVRLAFPADGASAAEGFSQRLTAQVSDPEGQVARVEFYDGTELLGASSQAPYTMPWMGRTGVHALTARAVDAAGLQATSAALSFTVTTGAPPALGEAPDDFAARVEPAAPLAGSSSVEFAPLTLSANLVTVTGGTVDRVEFYVLDLDSVGFGNPGTLRFIGSANAAPYRVVWARPTRGRFALVPRATSTLGRGSSATTGAAFFGSAANVSLSPDAMASFTVGPALRDGVTTVTSPPSGTALELGNGLVVKANAVGQDGTRDTVARVQFLVNGQVVDTQDNTLVRIPFAIRWLPSALGSYVLSTLVTDSVSGLSFASKPVTVNVIAKGGTPPAGTTNRAPRLALTSPVNGLKLAAGTVLRVSADAQDLDGQVVNVWFRNSIGDVQVKAAPYAFDWKATGSTASVWAEAEDNQGTITITPTATVTVQPLNQPPVVKLLTPAAATSISAGSAFTLVAEASDADGTVAKVEFFDNGRLMGTATQAPWRLSGVASYVGPHIISARATDNAGASTTTPPVAVSVIPTATNVPPTVALTTPGNQSAFLLGAVITLQASAADADGSVVRVEFLDGSAVIGTASGAPYLLSWANAATGTHRLTARAFDNAGASTSSTQVTVAVINPPVNVPPTVPLGVPIAKAALARGSASNVGANAADGASITSPGVPAPTVAAVVAGPLAR